MNFNCKSCGATHTFPDPEPKVVVKTEPCRCGITDVVRGWRWGALCIISLILSIFGGCWLDHHYTLESIRAVEGEGYEVQERKGTRLQDVNGPKFRVVPKEPQK